MSHLSTPPPSPDAGAPVHVGHAPPRASRLEYSDRRYVKNLAAATGVILVGIFVSLGAAGMSALVWKTRAPRVLTHLVNVIPFAILLVGTWKLTVADLTAPAGVDRPVMRWLARIGALAALGRYVAAVALCALSYWGSCPRLAEKAMTVSPLAWGVIETVGFFALFGYFRTLAQRIPDRGLARQTRTVMWGYGAARLFGPLLLALAVTTLNAEGTAESLQICAISVLFLLLLLGFGLWWLILLVGYRRQFQLKAQMAKRLSR